MFSIIFIASFVSLYILVWIAIVCFSISSKRINCEKYKSIEKKRNAWLLGSLFWIMIDYLLPILSLLCSAMVIFFDHNQSSLQVNITSLLTEIATICATLSLIINPKKHARSYRIAFTIVDYVIDLFNEGLISVFQLLDIVNTCEGIISQSLDSTLEKEIVDKLNNLSPNSDIRKRRKTRMRKIDFDAKG